MSDDSDDDCDLEHWLSNDPYHAPLEAIARLLLVRYTHKHRQHLQCCFRFIYKY